MAPSGCMQYFRAPSDVVKSFNYGPSVIYLKEKEQNCILILLYFFH